MNNNLNIFEKQKIIDKVEEIKKDVIRRASDVTNRVNRGFKKIILKGISLGVALSIIMSSVAFGGTHTVDNWEDYKRAIVEDIMKQDTEIILDYKGEENFDILNDLKEIVSNLYVDARKTIFGTVENENIRRSTVSSSYIDRNENYFLNQGKYTIIYKNSAEDFQYAQEIIDEFIDENITHDMTDYEKIRVVYDFVLEKYEYGNVNTGNDEQDILDERNIWLGLNGELVVCEAYSMLFSKMVSTLGFNNMIISGEVGNRGFHSWNLIEIDGQWYHVDPTWGDGESEGAADKYFLISSTTINDTTTNNIRTWNEADYPSISENDYIEEQVQGVRDKFLDLKNSISNLKEQVENLEDIQDLNDLDEIESFKNNIYDLINQVENFKGELEELKEEIQYLTDKGYDLNDLDLDNLDNVLEEIDLESVLNQAILKESEILIEKANNLVETAEASKIQEDVDSARELVARLSEGEEKDNLFERLDILQAEIDYQIALQEAIEAVEIAEDTKTQGDVYYARNLVNNLSDSENKDELNARLDNIEIDEQKTLLQEAIQAVEKAEDTRKQEDIDYARNLVNELPDSEDKDKLIDRLDIVQAEIDKQEEQQNLIKGIENDIEDMANLDEAGNIQDKINEVEDEDEKQRLEDKLNNKIEELTSDDEDDPLEKAIEAVETAEVTKDQDDVDYARDLVSQLLEGEDKNSLNNRLNAVQFQINEQIAYEEKIEEIENKINNMTDVSEAVDIQQDIDNLPSGNDKNRLQQKLDNKINILENEDENNDFLEEVIQAVELAEQAKTQGTVDYAKELVNQLPSGNDKDELNLRLDIVQDKINYQNTVDKAINAVEIAERTKKQEDVDFAFSLVNNLSDEELKDTLTNRLNEVEITESEDDNTGDETDDPSENEDEDDKNGDEQDNKEKEDEENDEEMNDEDDEENDEKVDSEDDEETGESETSSEDENNDDEEAEEPKENPSEDDNTSSDDETEKPENPIKPEKPEKPEPIIPERPTRPTRPTRPNRPNKPIIREEEKEEDTSPIEKKEIKSEEEIKKERLEISKKKINELNTILKVLPNTQARIKVGDKEIKPDVKPYIYKEDEEKVLVPIRFVAEALGFDVNWSENTWHQGIKKVFLGYEGKGIIMEIGKELAYVNGRAVMMDIVPELKNDRTYVSLDFIAEMLEVDFDYISVGGVMEFNIK